MLCCLSHTALVLSFVTEWVDLKHTMVIGMVSASAAQVTTNFQDFDEIPELGKILISQKYRKMEVLLVYFHCEL